MASLLCVRINRVPLYKGGLPLARNFYASTHVKIEAMCGRSRVHVKVEPRSTFTFTRGLSCMASILFTVEIELNHHFSRSFL